MSDDWSPEVAKLYAYQAARAKEMESDPDVHKKELGRTRALLGTVGTAHEEARQTIVNMRLLSVITHLLRRGVEQIPIPDGGILVLKASQRELYHASIEKFNPHLDYYGSYAVALTADGTPAKDGSDMVLYVRHYPLRPDDGIEIDMFRKDAGDGTWVDVLRKRARDFTIHGEHVEADMPAEDILVLQVRLTQRLAKLGW